jgi:hypothetical protein
MCSLYWNEYRNLKLAGATTGGEQGGVKRIRGDEPVGVIQICMEIPQGISLCSYRYLKQAKMSCFFLFIFFLLQNQRTGGLNPVRDWGSWHQWESGGGKG